MQQKLTLQGCFHVGKVVMLNPIPSTERTPLMTSHDSSPFLTGVWSQGQEAWLLFETLCQRWREFCRFFSQLCTYFVLRGFFKLFFIKWYNSIFVAWMLIFLSHHTIVKFLTWKRLFNVYKRYYLKFTSTFVVIESILGTDVSNFCDDYS